MKKKEVEFEAAVKKALQGKKIPILVLDRRWHALFPRDGKPSDIDSLEKQLNDLLKRQGYLVNDIKELKKTKKQLMQGIVAGMSEPEGESTNKKKKNQQRLFLEIRERIDGESDELLEIPGKIKQINEKLLLIGVQYCFERLADWDEQLHDLSAEIQELYDVLEEKQKKKEEMEESMDSAYSLMHGILGHEVMNLYDKKKK